MKRFVSLLAVLLCFVMLAMPFAAHAEASDDVIAALEEAIPTKYQALYIAQAKNLLAQVDVSDAQAKDLIDLIDEVKKAIDNKGKSLHEYSHAEKAFLLNAFNKAMKILNLTYRFEEKDKALHNNDIVCYVYNAEGKLLIKLDGDVAADKTDAADTGALYLVLTGAFLAVSALAFVGTRKITAR